MRSFPADPQQEEFPGEKVMTITELGEFMYGRSGRNIAIKVVLDVAIKICLM